MFVFTITHTQGSCPSGAVQSITTSSICYSFISVPESYADAEQICTDQRGHLTSIDNGFTNVFITGLFEELPNDIDSFVFQSKLKKFMFEQTQPVFGLVQMI